MPQCSATSDNKKRVSWNTGTQKSEHIVTIELLPAANPSAKHNKFKILSIVSC